MKRKLFLAVIMVLVLCLTCGMLLVACDKDDPVEPTPPPPSTNPVEMNFTEAWNEVTTALANNAEYSLAIEIRNNEEEVAPIFGLAIEYLDGEYVLYGAVNSNVYMKFNGFDLTSLLNQIGALVGMNDLVNLLQGLVANMVFAGTTVDVYGGNVYDLTVTQNTGAIISELSSMIEGIIPSEEIKNTINSVINTLSGFLGFELADGTAVTDLTTLLRYVGELIATHDISIVIGTGDAVTNDENDPFGGVISGITPAIRNGEAKNLLKFSVDGTVTGYKNQAEGAPVANHTYTIDVDVDINPFELLAILDAVEKNEDGSMAVNMSKDEIIALIKSVGYIGVQVNEVGADNAVIQNILTLYYNSGDYAIAALQSHPALSMARLGLGGVYNLDALIDVVGMLTAPAGGASEPQQGSDSGFDFDKIIGIVETVMGYIDLDNIAVDGVTIDFAGLVPEIVKLIMPEGNAMAEGAVMDILGSDSLNIKFGAFNFGKSEKTEAKDLIANLRLGSNEYTNSSLTENHGNYIVDITGAPGLSDGDKIGLGSDITSGMTLSNAGYEGIYLFNGTDIDGNAAVTSGIIMDVIGFDPNTLGEQTVTVYVGVVTDFYFALKTINGFLETPITLDPMWPLFGVLRYDATIEVVNPLDSYEEADRLVSIVFGQFTGEVNSISITAGTSWYAQYPGTGGFNMSLAFEVDGSYIEMTAADLANPNNIRIESADGTDITAEVIAAGGVINDAGTYTLTMAKSGYGAEIDIIVS